MREIKFRAWHKEKKEIVNVEEIDFMNKVINYIDNDYENNRQEIIGAYFEDIELMEYIGLKDEYGDEIYEGDIVTLHNSRYKVIFNSKEARFVLKDAFFEMDIPFTNNNNERMEIVGNIYENPELLGDKNDF